MLSTVEADYITASEAAHEAVRLRQFLWDLEIVPHILDPVTLQCYSMASIGHAKNRYHAKTKHIDVKLNFIRI